MQDSEFSLDRCSLCSAQPVAVFWPCGDMELLLSLCGSGPVPGWDKF